MEKLIIVLVIILSIFSCRNEIHKNEKTDWEIRMEKRKIAIDSLYEVMAKNYKSERGWEDFEYNYLYQLQDYLEKKNGSFTVKEFYNYQIYRKDTSHYYAFRVNQFKNEIFLELEIEKTKAIELSENKSKTGYNFYEVAVIEIDEFKPIDIEFESELDDYYSRIIIDRYKSLFGKGRVKEMKFIKEKSQ